MYSFSSSSSRTLVISISSSKCSSSSCIMANLLAGTRAQCTVLIQQLLQLVCSLYLVDTPSIRRHLREALEVESEMLAHLLDSNDLTLESDLAVDMFLHNPEPLVNFGLPRTSATQNIVYLLEDPRIPESRPSYHHVVGSSVVEKLLRVLRLLTPPFAMIGIVAFAFVAAMTSQSFEPERPCTCLLYTSDAADDLLCVDLGG